MLLGILYALLEQFNAKAGAAELGAVAPLMPLSSRLRLEAAATRAHGRHRDNGL